MENVQASPEKKEQAKTPAGDTASAETEGAPAKPKPAAGKAKEEDSKKPLVDNGDGTITDPNSGLMWKKTDAWIDMHKFYTWKAHREYVDWVNKNKSKFGGYDNWRIPTKAESLTLFDKTGANKLLDKNGTYYPLDPIFAPDGASNTWIAECSDDKIIRMDLKIGVDTPYPAADVWSSMRLVRKEGEAPPPPVGGKPSVSADAEAAGKTGSRAESATAKSAAAPKPAAAKPASGGGTPAPKPRKDFSDAEKAAMKARAKAHAAEVKARKAKG